MALHLILGGARSGKSRYAESLAKKCQQPVTYIATANADDDEMQARILQHQADRPSHWTTLEVSEQLSQSLISLDKDQVIIVDCLTLWLMNCFNHHPAINQLEIDQMIAWLENTTFVESKEIIIVSNEISMGVVPMGALSRDFVDTLGRIHQQIASQADQVTLMVAGIPMRVK